MLKLLEEWAGHARIDLIFCTPGPFEWRVMAILEKLAEFKREKNLEFMVIGGHAVISHGYSRRTLDLDILVQRAHGQQWKDCVLGLGYTLLYETENFFQCTAPDSSSWPLDFMMVSAETFDKFMSGAVSVLVQSVQVYVPSIQHLIALKLHAMKQGQRSRMFRDMDDVINLTRVARIDLESDEFKHLCHNYGNPELYAYLLRARPR